MINDYDDDDDDEFDILKAMRNSKEDNTPQWMKDFDQKQKTFSDCLQRVQDTQKSLVVGLQEFDQKQANHEKEMQIKRLILREEADANLRDQQDKINNKQYFENRAYQRNQKLPVLQINHHLLCQIILYDEDPIVLAMNMRRVCRRWYFLLDKEEIWQNICRVYLGQEFMNLNNSKDQWKQISYYFCRGWVRSKQFFRKYIQILCPTDITVWSVIQESIFVLLYLQQLLSIQDRKSLLLESFYSYIPKIRQALTYLSKCSHPMVKYEARILVVFLVNTKIFQDESPSLITKQLLNAELCQRVQTVIPALLWYQFTEDKLQGVLRDSRPVKQMYRLWNGPEVQAILYYQNRYGVQENKPEFEEFVALLDLNKGHIVGTATSASQSVQIEGNIKFTYPKYSEGVEKFGEGNLKIDFYGKSLDFKSYLVIGIGATESKNLIVGNHENRLLFIIHY